MPTTFKRGVTQRKRWVCGFFQSLGSPLVQMGMTARQRFRARLNLVPSLSLLINPLGLAVGIWILEQTIAGRHPKDLPLTALSVVNIVGAVVILTFNWVKACRVSGLVLSGRDRWRFALRVNPLFVMAYWLFWSVSLLIGIQMFLRDRGLVWERTEKIDANHDLVRVFLDELGPQTGQTLTSAPVLDNKQSRT